MHLGLCEQLGVCRFTGYKFCIQEAQSVVVETGVPGWIPAVWGEGHWGSWTTMRNGMFRELKYPKASLNDYVVGAPLMQNIKVDDA